MQTTADFLDALRAKLDLPSDRKLSFYLGMEQTTITALRSGRRIPGEKLCFRFAELLEINGAYVYACIKADNCENHIMRKDWLEVAEKFGVAA